ncbi:hypothetical protein [Acaryochloris sp. IP29b_bin.137]|uniref:hypothetical protein n=1 Tax=Acaryochloris sp. IP29b_bin.137 TaxID=2969217 RepID=UPI002610D49C|nr:hypothetical protein [Acaryochloris sp. IP29b_bin.137]
MTGYNQSALDRTSLTVGSVVFLWITTVVVAAQSGFLSHIYLPVVSLIVGTTIALPTIWYMRSQSLQTWIKHVGQRQIVAFHIWRIPAAILFFYFGLRGDLPTVFWVLAGVGDFIAGAYAVFMTVQKHPTLKDYKHFHLIGFVDFVMAVGTGLTYTVLQDPKIATITVLPMALIPLFGVGISGASHLISFDIMKQRQV